MKAAATDSQISVTVRAVRPLQDAERIAYLCKQLGYDVLPEQVRERLIGAASHNPQMVTYVADLPDQPVVGWIQVYVRQILISELSAEIEGLVVDEGHRGQGIGKALLDAAEEWAVHEHCRKVRLRSNLIRKEAHLFYQSLGYTITKQQAAFEKDLAHDHTRT